MKYYKQNSNPLEEDFPINGERSYDQYGNYVEIDAVFQPVTIKQSVLNLDETIDTLSEKALGLFWRLSKKDLEGYEVQDQTE